MFIFSVEYLDGDEIFDVELRKINSDKNFHYDIDLNINNKFDSKLKYKVEVFYENQNLLLAEDSISCKSKCNFNLNLKRTIFGKHKVIFKTKYDGKFYKKEIFFDLNLDKIKARLNMQPAYRIINGKSNILGYININSEKEIEYDFKIYPKSSINTVYNFNQVCIGSCSFDLELENELLIDDYVIEISSSFFDLKDSFNLVYDFTAFNNIIKKENKKDLIIKKKKINHNNKLFNETYDEKKRKKVISINNYVGINRIEIETEDIFGKKNRKIISNFKGDLEVDLAVKHVKIISKPNVRVNSIAFNYSNITSNLNNSSYVELGIESELESSVDIEFDLKAKVDVYSNLEDLKKKSKSNDIILNLNAKIIINETVVYGNSSFENFDEFYDIYLEDSNQIRPGLGKIEKVLNDGSSEIIYFAYGLISVNTKKPIYKVNEKIDVYLIVLDKNGDLYPDAKIDLIVSKSLSTSVSNFSSVSNFIDSSNSIDFEYYDSSSIKETIKTGLYYLNISSMDIGKYNIFTSVEVDGIELDISSYFNVVENYSYDILRKVPFTIDPWQGAFENEFTIISYNDIGRFSFYEELPKNFIIYETNGAKIIETNNSKILKWNSVHENFKPWYRANSPLITPYLYELGRSWIEYNDNGFLKRFYENRSWFFAIDPATTFEKGDIEKQIKTFFLDNNGGSVGLLDMINPGSSTSERINEGNSFDYDLVYNLNKDLDIEDKIILSLTLCMDQCGNNKNGDLKVEVYDSIGNLIATETRLKIINDGSNPSQELFILSPLVSGVSAGDGLKVRITSVKKNTDIYTGNIDLSYFDIYTYDHIEINDITLKNSSSDSVIFNSGDDVNIYTNITDVLRIDDISLVELSVYYPDGSLKIDSLVMTHQSNFSDWVYYNYTTSVLGGDPIGTYTVEITAYEGSVNHVSRAFYSKLSSSGNAVSIVPFRSGTANPEDVVELVHYVFNLDDSSSHSYNLFTNSSYTVSLYEDNGVTLLVDNDGDEVIDTGTINSGNFKKIVAKVSVPVDAFIGSDNIIQIIVKPAATNHYGIENFESYSIGDDPVNWYDSAAGFSLVNQDVLFDVKSVSLNKALGTSSISSNIHSHYNGSGALSLKDYEITGKLRYSDINSSIGITFLSDYPNSNEYYSFRMQGANSSSVGDGTANQFHLFSNIPAAGVCSGDINSNQNVLNNTWYDFRIRVNDTGSQTNILAKIWDSSASEYPFWQIECNDSSVSRLSSGTSGFWTSNLGSKYIDEFRIADINIDENVVDTVEDSIFITSNIKETKELYLHDNSGTYELNTSLKSSNNIRRITRNSKITFSKLPSIFYDDFYLNGSINAPLYIVPQPGKNGGKSTITVSLYHGSTLVGTDTHVDVTNIGIGLPFIETFIIEPIIEFIPENTLFTVEVASSKKATDLYLDYSSNPSKISFPTFTYISVTGIDVFNSSGSEKEIYDVNETMVFKINVSDPFERAAIDSINLTILDPNNLPIYSEVIPSLESFGSFWEYYNFTFTNTSEAGTYTINVNVREDNGVVKTGTTTRLVLSNVPAVSIIPNRLGSVTGGNSKIYEHSVTNANGIDYDIIDLNVSSSFSTVTLYQSDGVSLLTDTNGNGLVDLGYVAPGDTVTIIANIFIPEGSPIDSIDYTNITAISDADNSKQSTITDETTVLLGNPEFKQLHLHKPGGSYFLNVSTGNSQVLNERVNEGNSIIFNQEINFSRDFKFTSDLNVKLYLVAEPTKGANGKSTVKVELKTLSGISIGSKSFINIPWTSSPQLNIFTINPSITSISKDDGIQLIVTSVKKETDFSYGDSIYDALIEMETSTFINVKSIEILNSSLKLQSDYLYNTSYNITFKSNVTDPFGAYDIVEVNISIKSANGTYIVLNDPMILESLGLDYKYFNYTREFLADNDIGTYEVLINALESNGVVSNSSGSFLFLSNGPEVKISPDNIGETAANTSIEFIHTITNAYIEEDDIADIRYTINIGNVSFTDIAGTALIDTDSDGIIDSGTLSAGGGSKLIKAIIDVPSTLNPGDNITLNIYVNSSLNSSRQDSAVDIVYIINNIPELKTLYLHDNTNGVLNTSIGNLASTNKISIVKDTSFSFVQSPYFFKNFDHTGTYDIKLYVDTPGGKANLRAELRTSDGTLLGSETKVDLLTSGPELTVFSISPSIGSIPEGEGLNLTLFPSRRNLDIYFDSSTYDSKIDMNTLTYISVDSIKSYNTSLSEISLFAKNDTVILKVNVSDPFTLSDIIQSNITISYANGTKYIEDQVLTLESSGSYWKYYSLSIFDINTQIKGLHSIEVISLERNGVTSSGLGEFSVDNIAPVISELSSSPSFLAKNENTSIRVKVIENLELKNVSLYLTNPNSTNYIIKLIDVGSNFYEYNFSETSLKGVYTYYVNASDTSENIAISASLSFRVIGPRIAISIENNNSPNNDSYPLIYKSGQDLNILSSTSFESLDKEVGIIKLNVSNSSIDVNTSGIIYSEVSGINYSKLSNLGLRVLINYYNTSFSILNSSNIVDLEVSFFNGSSYINSQNCDLNLEYGESGDYDYNCTIYDINESLLSNWAVNPLNRRVSIRGLNLDNNGSLEDSINYSSVELLWDSASSIRNFGFSNLTNVNLSFKIQENSSGSWVDFKTVYNNKTIINIGDVLDLSSIWNSEFWTLDDGIDFGIYRTYVSLISEFSAAIIIDDFDNLIEDFYIFEVDYLKINVVSPNSTVNESPSGIWFNVSLDSLSFSSGGFCSYSLNLAANVSMNQINTSYFAINSSTYDLVEGVNNLTFYCNDSQNYYTKINSSFSYYDDVSPIISLIVPSNNSIYPTGNITFSYSIYDDSNIVNCSLYVDNILENISLNPIRQSPVYLGVFNISDGEHFYNISCYDSSILMNSAVSLVYNFTVDSSLLSNVTHLQLTPSITHILDSSYNIKLSLQNLAPNQVTMNKTLFVYGFLPNSTIISTNFVYESSSRYSSSVLNESIISNGIQGNIYEWKINYTDSNFGVLSPYFGVSNNDNSWFVEFNVSSNRTQIDEYIILSGFDPSE